MMPGSEAGSSSDAITLLAIGDVHLGTRPASLPGDLAEWGVDPRRLTPEAALGAAVDRAIAERVDAVVFAGEHLSLAGVALIGKVGCAHKDRLPRCRQL